MSHGDRMEIMETLLLPAYKGFQVIKISDIIRIQAVSNYSRLICNNGKSIIVAKVLAWFEEKLDTKHFIRIHRTHLINTRFITGYNSSAKFCLKLSNGENIAVSRRKRHQLRFIMDTIAA